MIDYRNLAAAQEFYTQKGYKYMEVPWMVTQEVLDITKPKDAVSLHIPAKNKCLVGSAEQSFLYLMVKGWIAPGLYQTITPCFRDETNGINHRKNFMKLELIEVRSGLVTQYSPEYQAAEFLYHASAFYAKQLAILRTDLTIRTTEIGFDIEYNGVELGSYGFRTYKHLSWVYGTGCAEPRLTDLQIDGWQKKSQVFKY